MVYPCMAPKSIQTTTTRPSTPKSPALTALKQKLKQGNQLISQALDLDEEMSVNDRGLSADKGQLIEKAKQTLKLYLEGGEILKTILDSKITLSKREMDELSDIQVSVRKTLEMINGRATVLMKTINDPKNRKISIPKSSIPLAKAKIEKERLPVIKGVDAAIVARVMDEVVDASASKVSWNSVAGLERQKALLKETILLPFQRPDIFVGVRAPPRGILMFGPPGTGKTLLAKAAASTAHCTFFSLSAASITSKWLGESEKLVRALFACARHFQPAIIFIDEIDSLLQSRGDAENEAMRRVKTEFLVQFDGMNSRAGERIIVIGATNRPGDLDEAARRRFTKRILIPLPDTQARGAILHQLLNTVACNLTPRDYDKLVQKTEGYSAADITALASDIAMNPVREMDARAILTQSSTSIRPINWSDVEKSLINCKSSVDPASIKSCEKWNDQFGSS